MEKKQEQAINYLRGLLKPGDTVRPVLRHVSKSGMFRLIDLYVVTHDGGLQMISANAADAIGEKLDKKRQGIRVSGCGMDMGFSLVYNLGRVLFPDGFKVKGTGRNGDKSGWDKDGGHALNCLGALAA